MSLTINHLSAGYNNHTIISDINVHFDPGTITCILGPNGSGKSTLLKSIVGLCDVYNGKITLNEQSLLENTSHRYKNISYLAQNHTVPQLSVKKLVLHGRFPHLGYPRKYSSEDYDICTAVMKALDIEHLRKQSASRISGGELQKVYFAMSLVTQADIYLLDEPNSFLDIRYQLDIYDRLKRMKAEGKTIVMILHDINRAMQIADAVLLLEHGQVRRYGSPEDIYTSGDLNTVFGINCTRFSHNDTYYYYTEKSSEF